MTKGTTSFGKRHTKTHSLCKRCGRSSYHLQKKQCASCGYPHRKIRKYNWSEKAIRRHTTGTGRLRHLKVVRRRFKKGFLDGRQLFMKKVLSKLAEKKSDNGDDKTTVLKL
ncbi:hypothetical protein SNEBB_001450 [Seison nebaliae]|nr:hypothetical protein SNEBB_001450 [Seison nebaliae]